MTKIRAAILTLIFIALNWPVWADDGHGHNHHDGGDDGSAIDIDIDGNNGGAGGHGGAGGDGGDGGAGGTGGNSDADAESNSQAAASANGEQNITFEGTRSVGRGYIGGGSSSSDHQKVRAISGGWLSGMASIRWDATDKELRTLDRADRLRDRGMISAADKLECSAKVIYIAIGGDPDACYTELAGSHVVTSEKRSNRDLEQDQLILALQMQLTELQQRAVPKIAEEQTVVRMEVAQVAETVQQEAEVHDDLSELTAQYDRDRLADQKRRDGQRDYAQSTLNMLAEKGYTAIQQTEEPPDESAEEF